MSIVFYNNWRKLKEFRVIDISVNINYPFVELSVGALGLGVMIVFNTN